MTTKEGIFNSSEIVRVFTGWIGRGTSCQESCHSFSQSRPSAAGDTHLYTQGILQYDYLKILQILLMPT